MTASTDRDAAPGVERRVAETGDRESRVIEVRDLTKRFGDVVAVDGLSFEISRGSIVGFLGPNGAGKTTTLRMLLGLIEPTSGSATIDGRAYRELPEPLREVGAMLEASSFHPGRTARSHLRTQADAAGVARSRVGDALELVDLAHAADRRVAGFSQGMRQRLGLATALLPDPQILILDEPANGLDPEGVRWLRDLLRGLADRGRTVLVSSHVLAEVAQTVESVIILHEGRLVVHQPLSELTAGARRVVHVRTPGAEALGAALATIGGEARITGSDRLDVAGASAEEIGTLAARHQIPIFEIRSDHPSLEEVFLELTHTSAGEKVEQ